MLTFAVPGNAVAQGSMKYVGGRKIIYSNHDRLMEWRSKIRECAREVMRDHAPFEDAVAVEAMFWLTRPKVAHDRPYPSKRPDLDKLARAVGDAITGVIVSDDSLIVRWTLNKEYAPTGMNAQTIISIALAAPPHSLDCES